MAYQLQPGVRKAALLQLASLDFLDRAENLVFIGPTGVAGQRPLAAGTTAEPRSASTDLRSVARTIQPERLRRYNTPRTGPARKRSRAALRRGLSAARRSCGDGVGTDLLQP